MRYYYLICRFVIMTLQLRLKFRVALIGGDILRFRNGRALIEKTRRVFVTRNLRRNWRVIITKRQ